MKSNPLRILVLEDVPADVTLINHQLHRAGLAFETTRVETEEDFLQELAQRPPDVILSDHGLPSFDGHSALALACEKAPDTPFIFVTGSTTEELTMDELRIGAPDYVLKTRLSSLVPAIMRGLRLTEERARRKHAERALRASEERFKVLARGTEDLAIALLDADGRVTSWNFGAEKLTGWLADEVVGWPLARCYTPEERERGVPEHDLKVAARDGRFEAEGWRARSGSGKFWAHTVLTACRDESGRVSGFAQVTVDLIERAHVARTGPQQEALLNVLAENIGDAAACLLDAEGRISAWTHAAQRLDGYCAREIVGCPFSIFAVPEDAAQRKPEQLLARATADGRAELEGWRLRSDGARYRAQTTVKAMRNAAEIIEGFIVFVRELAARPVNETTREAATIAPAPKERNGSHPPEFALLTAKPAVPAKPAEPTRSRNGDTPRPINPLQRVREATEAAEAAQRSLDAIISQTRTPWGSSALLGSTQVAEVEKTMRDLRGRLAERELALAEAENKLRWQERDLAETEALLVAREQLLAAMNAQLADGADALAHSISPEEIAALKQLKQELERQEQSLKEAKTALREREQFIEQSEAALLQKMQAQQEREIELEQRAEDLQCLSSRASITTAETTTLLEPVFGAAL